MKLLIVAFPTDTSSSTVPISAIAGGVVGAIVAVVVIIVLLILTIILIRKRRNSKLLVSHTNHDQSHLSVVSNFIPNDPKEERNKSYLLPLSEVESSNPASVTKHVRRPPPIPPSLRNELYQPPPTNKPTPSGPPSVNSHVHSHNGISSSQKESLHTKKPIPGTYVASG